MVETISRNLAAVTSSKAGVLSVILDPVSVRIDGLIPAGKAIARLGFGGDVETG
jgi:hypothetical protein